VTGRYEEANDDERWRLLVLEDTGELLVADAKERVGQGLSRFLNLVDGLIGQGLRTMVLVTTNESVGRLHPAVSRPGRCMATVEFGPLSALEANRWLAERTDARVSTTTTLAELYAIASGQERSGGEPGVAFQLPADAVAA
jgi:hypothetical protein